MAKDQAEIKHSTQTGILSNDLEKIQLVEEREEIYKEGYTQSQVTSVDKEQKDVRKGIFEKGKASKASSLKE